MEHKEKIDWLKEYAFKNKGILHLDGSVGFGRDCVGISFNDSYPDYWWFDEQYERIDSNGEVWIPEGAYHKHDCVCVLGHGEESEARLYEWYRWFEDHGFVIETGLRENVKDMSLFEIAMGQHMYSRIVKKND